nr:hypothetical protein [Gemmatimonadaceae bacterium]
GANTLGSIVGVVLAALVLMPLLGLKWLLVAGASVDVALGALLLLRGGGRPTVRVALPALAAAAALLVAGTFTRFDQSVLTSGVFRYGSAHAPQMPDVLFYKDGRTATVSVRRIFGSHGLSLATNGKPDASLGPEWFVAPATPGRFTHDASTQILLPLLTLAHVPDARTAAVIGQGSGMSTHTLLGDSALTSVLTIEIEPEMLRASRLFYPANRRAFDDPRSHVAIDDARSLFASRGERFDLILSEPSNPWVAGVSGLFTREFYRHARRFLTRRGVFGQWLHLTEINDGLVLSVVRAVAESFPAYTVYTVGNHDVLIVATTEPHLRPADWSVFARPGIAGELRRVVPITPAMLDALRTVDGATLAPLTRRGDGNSDFYPTLDIGTERSRYLSQDAAGFVGLAGDRFALATLLEPERAPMRGAPYAVIAGVPRLDAMELAARLREHEYTKASGPMLGAAVRAEAVDRLLEGGRQPIDWHVWVSAVREAEETRAGGSRGAADAEFLGRAATYAARAGAPSRARAALAFITALAQRNDAGVLGAGAVLMEAGSHGDHWLPTDVLREGLATTQLRAGDARGARRTMSALSGLTARGPGDLRASLLDAWITAAEQSRWCSTESGGPGVCAGAQ